MRRLRADYKVFYPFQVEQKEEEAEEAPEKRAGGMPRPRAASLRRGAEPEVRVEGFSELLLLSRGRKRRAASVGGQQQESGGSSWAPMEPAAAAAATTTTTSSSGRVSKEARGTNSK